MNEAIRQAHFRAMKAAFQVPPVAKPATMPKRVEIKHTHADDPRWCPMCDSLMVPERYSRFSVYRCWQGHFTRQVPSK